MPEVTYTSVVWTAGDFITEAKLDSMTANDRAVDAMNNGVQLDERADPSTPPTSTLHIYAKDKNGLSTLYAINDAGTVYELAENRPTFIGTVVGTLVTGTSLTPIIIVHRDLTIVKAYGAVKTAPTGTGAKILVDINKNGQSIWASTPANRLAIEANETTGSQTSFDTVALSEGDLITFDIDQVGSTVPGADLTIALRCK